MAEQIKITLSDLKDKVEKGWKKRALAEYYGIPVSRMGAILKDAGLKIRSFRGPQVTLIDDLNEGQYAPQEKVESEENEENVENTEVNLDIQDTEVQENIQEPRTTENSTQQENFW